MKIQIEQQLKLYAESLQSKVEESEKVRTDLLEQTKTMISVFIRLRIFMKLW